MKFVDTRNPTESVSFSDAIFSTLAPDGGLYQPASDADVRQFLLYMDESTSFQELSEVMISSLFEDEINPGAAARIAKSSFPFSPVFRTLDEHFSLLELYHGPTGVFKDFGVSFLAAVLEEFISHSGRSATVLTASTGDTGCAVARAFHGRKDMRVVVLVPSSCGSASSAGESRKLRQLAAFDGNVLSLHVRGNFDDCQRLARSAFENPAVRDRFSLISANSLNPGRLIPQTFYYVYAFTRLKKTIHGDFFFSVPSGNLGNLTAGIYAWKWGMPVNGFVAATNANDEIPRYLANGVFSPREPVRTVSDAMDVGNPANFERLLSVFGSNPGVMRTMIDGESVTDDETLDAIRRVYETHGVLIDPHTAVGYRAAEKFLSEKLDGQGSIIVLATGDPYGSADIVEKATGVRPEPPAGIAALPESDRNLRAIDPDLGSLVAALESFDK
jgi:threonine synthase